MPITCQWLLRENWQQRYASEVIRDDSLVCKPFKSILYRLNCIVVHFSCCWLGFIHLLVWVENGTIPGVNQGASWHCELAKLNLHRSRWLSQNFVKLSVMKPQERFLWIKTKMRISQTSIHVSLYSGAYKVISIQRKMREKILQPKSGLIIIIISPYSMSDWIIIFST